MWKELEGKSVFLRRKNIQLAAMFIDHITLIFLYKPINYSVICSLYGVACSDTVNDFVCAAYKILLEHFW